MNFNSSLIMQFLILAIFWSVDGNINANKPKLIYFDAKGAAELSRILMKVGSLDYDDFRYPIVVSLRIHFF